MPDTAIVVARRDRPGWEWRPDPVAALLCRAGLAEGDASVDAFERAMALVPLDDLDGGTHRLLPLVSRRLAAVGWDGPEAPILRGLHRRTWFENVQRMEQVRPYLETLVERGIPCLLLKGAALASSVYPDVGCRPMGDVDVLVPGDRATEAMGLLLELGWEPMGKIEFGPSSIAAYAGLNFHRPADGLQIDLHWRLSYEHRNADVGRYWDRALPWEWRGIPLLRLDPTDQLAHTLVHAMRWNEVSPARWVVDAALVLRTSGGIDAVRLRRDAEADHVVPAVRDGLEHLHSVFGIGADDHLPPEIVVSCVHARAGWFDELVHRVRVAPPTRRTTAARLLFVDFALRSAGAPLGARLRSYPSFLRTTLASKDEGILRTTGRVLLHGPSAKPSIAHAVQEARTEGAGR